MPKSRSTGYIIGGLVGAALAAGAYLLVQRWRKVPLATGRIELLEVPVDPLTMEWALARIEEFIASGQPHHIFTADASGIMQAQENPELRAIVQEADLVTPDGAGVLLASQLLGARLPERVSGVDLVERISALAAKKGYKVFLLGATDEAVTGAAEALQARYPGLQIAGVQNGYFTAEEEPAIVRKVARTEPDVLFVALGIPKQEIFIRRHFKGLHASVMIGVGGSFDVISGKLKRAPQWMQRSGLEWLYRFLQQPSRLPRLAALPKFVVAAWRARKK